MIIVKKREDFEYYKCDACGQQLSTEGQLGEGGKVHGVHYAELANHFGYGSPLDFVDHFLPRRYHLCEACYKKACVLLGLPSSEDEIPEHLYIEFENPTGIPQWKCKDCRETIATGYFKIPSHRCRSVTPPS